jgi:hypothetical protein
LILFDGRWWGIEDVFQAKQQREVVLMNKEMVEDGSRSREFRAMKD